MLDGNEFELTTGVTCLKEHVTALGRTVQPLKNRRTCSDQVTAPIPDTTLMTKPKM